MAKTYQENSLLSELSDDAYNEAPGVRSTALKAAVKSPAHFNAYLAQPRADTPAFRFGRLAHLAVLQPDVFAAKVHERPDVGDMRSPKNRAALADWKAGLPADAADVSAEEMAHLAGMVRAARKHPRLSQLLQKGRAEHSLFWRDDAHQMPCKARYDWVSENGVVCDLKTTTDASSDAFGRDVIKHGYPLSAAHYLEGARVADVANPDTFVLVAIEKVPPYGIGLYTLGSDVLDWGHQWRHHAMLNIGRAMRGDNSGYPDQFQVLELPKWAPRPVEFSQ